MRSRKWQIRHKGAVCASYIERSPNPCVRGWGWGEASDDIPLFASESRPAPEIFLGRRYSGTAMAKSWRSCQAFLRAFQAPLFVPLFDASFLPFALCSRRRVLQLVCACACFIFIYRRVLILSPSDERGRKRGVKWSLSGRVRRKKSGETTSVIITRTRKYQLCFVSSARPTRRRWSRIGVERSSW